MNPPTLYSFRRCPYAMRARMAIAVSGQQCTLREVLLKDKPDAMLAASPKGTVPVLVLEDGAVIDESLDVMHWALAKDDPEDWLAPLRENEQDALALIEENDGPFKANLDRYKYPNRYDGVDPLEHRAAGLAFLRKLDALLAGRAFLAGDRFTFLDAAIVPFVRQFANTDKAWFDQTDLSHVPQWLDATLASERFTRVMEKYPVWKTSGKEVGFPSPASSD